MAAGNVVEKQNGVSITVEKHEEIKIEVFVYLVCERIKNDKRTTNMGHIFQRDSTSDS